ncbi:hypothetical protein [Leptolyngbya iicbica]
MHPDFEQRLMECSLKLAAMATGKQNKQSETADCRLFQEYHHCPKWKP